MFLVSSLTNYTAMKYAAGIAQLVLRLATGWTAGGSKPFERLQLQHHSKPSQRPTQPSVKWVRFLLFGSKLAGEWLLPPTSFSTENKERVELYLIYDLQLYLYSSMLSWLATGRNLLYLIRKVKEEYCFITFCYFRCSYFQSRFSNHGLLHMFIRIAEHNDIYQRQIRATGLLR